MAVKTTSTITKKTTDKKSVTGKKQEVLLPAVFGQKVSETLIHQAIRVYQTNLYQGTKKTKTRGEVAGSTRKIYRQKGTGRARHGSIKAPVFVGGGIVFGPMPHQRRLKLSRREQVLALTGILSKRKAQNKVTVLSELDSFSGKTKDMVKLLATSELTDKHILLILDPSAKKATLAARNIADVSVAPPHTLNVLDVMTHEHIVLSPDVLPILTKRLTIL